jgi:hypothetical protein
MRSYTNFIILFVSICLSSEVSAQYEKIFKGQPAPYDTGVVIEISEYIKIRFKVTFADSLISTLNTELSKSYTLIQEKDSAQSVLIAMSNAQSETISMQAKTIQDVNRSFDELFTVVNRPKKFLEKPLPLLGTGFVIGIVSVALIKSAAK